MLNAKNRKCFFNAEENKDLAKAILDGKKELDKFDKLLNTDNARWKVYVLEAFTFAFHIFIFIPSPIYYDIVFHLNFYPIHMSADSFQ